MQLYISFGRITPCVITIRILPCCVWCAVATLRNSFVSQRCRAMRFAETRILRLFVALRVFTPCCCATVSSQFLFLLRTLNTVLSWKEFLRRSCMRCVVFFFRDFICCVILHCCNTHSVLHRHPFLSSFVTLRRRVTIFLRAVVNCFFRAMRQQFTPCFNLLRSLDLHFCVMLSTTALLHLVLS